MKTIFLTGGTGFIGSYLLQTLLLKGYKVFCLVRKDSPKNILNCLEFWNKRSLPKIRNNFEIINGDIRKSNLEINSQDTLRLRGQIDEIFHCAAGTNLREGFLSLKQVNVDGTFNILSFAEKISEGRLRKVNYFSTVYVCGDYQGKFMEDSLDMGQSFNTSYEKTKFLAEKQIDLFRKKGLWIDIYRPPIVLGESSSGKTPSFQSIFQAIHLFNMEIFDVYPAKDVPSNIICVDSLVNAILLINEFSKEKNCTYHPFHETTILFEEMIYIASKYLGYKMPKLVRREEFKIGNLSAIQRRLLENTIFTFNPSTSISSIKTMQGLRSLNFEIPRFDENTFLRLLKYSVDCNFIKRKTR
ncbi:MAG TPA: SDR family oxidoreductase [Candidatus Omnitrophota bacterium]|nr:SDR family oxidoreductase [Candidatus Omnitrophota bacterium]